MIPELHDHPAARGPFLHALVVAPASHRAIDETLSDWRAETAQASKGLPRMACHLRYGLAMTRVLVGSLPREVGAVPFGPLSARFAFFGLIAMVTVVVPGLQGGQASLYRYVVTRPGGLWLPYLLTIPATQALANFLPLVWFYTTAWPTRAQMSRIGLFATMGCSAVLLTWVTGFETSSLWSTINGQSPMGVLEQSGRGILTLNFVQFRLLWVLGLGLLGTTLTTASRAERWGWRVGLPTAFAAVALAFSIHPTSTAWMAAGGFIGRLIGPSIWSVALLRLLRQSITEAQPGS